MYEEENHGSLSRKLKLEIISRSRACTNTSIQRSERTVIFDLAFRSIHRYVTVMKNASKAMDNMKRSSKF